MDGSLQPISGEPWALSPWTPLWESPRHVGAWDHPRPPLNANDYALRSGKEGEGVWEQPTEHWPLLSGFPRWKASGAGAGVEPYLSHLPGPHCSHIWGLACGSASAQWPGSASGPSVQTLNFKQNQRVFKVWVKKIL